MKRLALSLCLLGLMASGALASAKPLTLEAAIQRALASHPDAVMAEARTKVADLAIGDAQSQRVQVTTDVSFLNRTSQSQAFGSTPAPSNANPNQSSYNGTVGLTVPVFTGFKLSNSVLAAERNRDAASAQANATRADLTLQVTRAFWTLRKAELIEDVQQTAIEQTERTLKLTRTGFQLGRQTISDVDRAEVSVLNAKGAHLQYRESTEEARLQLASLVGLPAQELEIDGEPETLKSALQEPAEADLLERLGKRPEIQAADARRAAAQASVAAARGDLWPQLSAIGTYQLGNNPYNPISGARDAGTGALGTADLRLAANFNVWDGGRTARAIARAEADLAQAEAELEKTRRSIRQEIDLAVVRVKGARERLAITERSDGIAAKTLKWVEARYQQGYSPQVEVNEALGSLVTARTQRVQALVDLEVARAELARALGTL